MVRVLPARERGCARGGGWLGSWASALDPAQTARRQGAGPRVGPSTLGQRLLCQTRTLVPARAPGRGMASLRKGANVLTGKTDAGKPPVRFGGRGGVNPRSYPNLGSPRGYFGSNSI